MMKEEAPSSKKMPRKTRAPQPAATAPSTPTKFGANDEILTSLLRLNNFDSNIKDESLDIDLSACVTISGDSAAMLGHNSLSSTDFWRVLDESAQNSQLDLANASDDLQQQLLSSGCLSDDGLDENSIIDAAAAYELVKNNKMVVSSKSYIPICSAKVGGVVIKEEKPEPNFSGTFLRPEAPPPTPSPIKRLMVKQQQHEQQRNAEQRYSPKAKIKRDLRDDISAVGQPSTYHLLSATQPDDAAVDNNIQIIANKAIKYAPTTSTPTTLNNVVVNNNKTISSTSSFNIFTLPETNAPSCNIINSGKSSSNTYNNTNQKNAASNSPAEIGTNNNNSSNNKLHVVSQEGGTSVPEPLFKCLDCDGLLLQGKGEYTTHEAIGHRIHYRCSVCDRDFEQEAGLKKHIKTHRSTDTRKDAWKKCPDCGKCLKLGSMWMHRKIHSDNKKYGCDICGQKFVQKINLTHHSRIHTAEKPYECPECQKRFQERSHLQRHQKYHAQTRSYRCEKCGKMYKTERCLKVHNLVHLEQRPFACTVCEKSFISNSKLKQHSNIHTGERPFKCNYCPRDFTNFPNWLKHTRRRHKVDHKTGEHLENIPSYCSKKSTKTAKAKAAEAANTDVAQTAVNTETKKAAPKQDNKISEMSGVTAVPTKAPAPAKRKKKSPQEQIPTTSLHPPQPQPPPPPPLVSISSDNRPLPTITVSTMSGIIKTEVTRSMNNIMTSIPLSMAPHLKPLTTSSITAVNKLSQIVETCKTAKPKRERKQPSPKQVQKATFPTPTLLSTIKREITEADVNNTKSNINTSIIHADPRYAISNFPDLSITSAEELIMEQALEMEECGWNVGQSHQASAALETDNAISSSEATAALHFKIKSEFDPMDLSSTTRVKEEYVTLKDVNQRLLCSSLESSPYSSPASVEMSAAPTIMSSTGQSCTDTDNKQSISAASANAYHTNPYTLNTKSAKTPTSLGNALSHQTVVELQNMLPQITTQLVTTTTQNQNSDLLPTTTTQAIINHFYLHPMTAMGMPLLTQASSANQKLPSVDTLLFSAAAAAAAAAGATTTCNASSSSNLALAQSRFYTGKSLASNASNTTATTPTHKQPKLT
ncbi:serendipity locus protein H-1 [Eurosta solidaginis]|uniref:serendipity locus protein H-1 n=1 Tax=Eurosta solidaginis TaxID=178769 RepID=UPI003531116F